MDLQQYFSHIEKMGLNVEGVVVYLHGKEIARQRRIPEKPKNVWSVSKSFTSIAIGMAIDEGRLKLSDSVTKILDRENPDARWKALTLEHLLTMTMGHPEYSRPDNIDEIFLFEITRDPGTYFLYDSACTLLASAMLTRTTGLKVRDYLLDRLFRRLGIKDPVWEESRDGYTAGAVGLEITTTDMAVFGQFLLQRGNWKGKQLVSSAWIEAATRTQVPTMPAQDKADYDLGYGYQFWTCRHGAFRCDGKNGQFIIVLPSLDAVIAINSDEENMKPILWAVWDYFLPELIEQIYSLKRRE
ncbi:MAG: beta-lactamase family protein [Treponema sp.]|nr:beta-lactamase family protein [Treponema sp.]